MPLHHLPSLINTKTTTLTFPSKPSATIPTSPFFRRLQSFFTVRMIEDCGGIFGLVSPWPWDIGRLLHSPNIVGDFGYGWGNKNGLMWIHGPKTNHQMCQTVADALFLPEHERDVKWKPNTLVIVGREIGHVFLLLLDEPEEAVVDFE